MLGAMLIQSRACSQSRRTPLFEWVKEALIVPTTNGVYGPQNPYRNSAAYEDNWTFFTGVPTKIKGGRWLVKDSVAAIDSLGLSWQEHFQLNGHKPYSGIVQKFKDENGDHVPTLDVTALKVSCPLLNSAFKEVLRLDAIGTGVRRVEEDYRLDEVFAFAVMLLLRFDIMPTAENWTIPSSVKAKMTTNMPEPDFDVDFEVRGTSDDRDVKWIWTSSNSEDLVMLGSQDEHGNETS
ncbi:heme binding [Ascochyta rabiei]|uniref:Heme binding n=1 Tax=Didymella rabiei TaxID=5454 RepID=A0A162ZBY0_DIDRA|nr:heme binding [Ascochyta rabiei]